MRIVISYLFSGKLSLCALRIEFQGGIRSLILGSIFFIEFILWYMYIRHFEHIHPQLLPPTSCLCFIHKHTYIVMHRPISHLSESLRLQQSQEILIIRHMNLSHVQELGHYSHLWWDWCVQAHWLCRQSAAWIAVQTTQLWVIIPDHVIGWCIHYCVFVGILVCATAVYEKASCTLSASLAVALGLKRPCQMTTCLFRLMELSLWCLYKAFLRMHLLLSNTLLQVCTQKQCPIAGVVSLGNTARLLSSLPCQLSVEHRGAYRTPTQTLRVFKSYLRIRKLVLTGHSHNDTGNHQMWKLLFNSRISTKYQNLEFNIS